MRRSPVDEDAAVLRGGAAQKLTKEKTVREYALAQLQLLGSCIVTTPGRPPSRSQRDDALRCEIRYKLDGQWDLTERDVEQWAMSINGRVEPVPPRVALVGARSHEFAAR